MTRMGQLLDLQLDAAALAGDSPRHGELALITLEAVDTPGNISARHGELLYIRLLAVTLAVEDFLPLTAKSLTSLTLTAALTDGTQADTWAWREITPTGTQLSANGDTLTLRTPATVEGTSVVIGVIATKQGTDSPEVTCTITVRPHQQWRKGAGAVDGYENLYVDRYTGSVDSYENVYVDKYGAITGWLAYVSSRI